MARVRLRIGCRMIIEEVYNNLINPQDATGASQTRQWPVARPFLNESPRAYGNRL